MRIKILYTQETIGSGGVERRRLNLIRALDKKHYEIKIICTKIEGPLANEMRAEGVEVIEIGLLSKIWDISKYRSVLRIIRAFKPHIIHGAVFEGVLLATIGGSLGRVPVIIAEETSDPVFRSTKANMLIRGLSYLADRFVGVSPAAYQYLLRKAKVNPHKVGLIVNGVTTPPEINVNSISVLKSNLGFESRDLIIGSVGRLFNSVKLFTELIEALSIVKDKYPNLKLLIVGGGPDEELIHKFASKKGVSERVMMAGYQQDPHPFFKLMNIFALVSSTESFGLAAVEAMFHKLPVIASKVGGLKDIIVHNKTGLLVDVHRPDQIAEAIDKLLSDQNTMKNMGENGYNRAINDYSAERYIRDVERMYSELLRKKQLI